MKLPPYRWFLPFGGSGPVKRIGPATTICACLGTVSRRIFGAETGMGAVTHAQWYRPSPEAGSSSHKIAISISTVIKSLRSRPTESAVAAGYPGVVELLQHPRTHTARCPPARALPRPIDPPKCGELASFRQRACKRRRMGVDIVQAHAAEISTERKAGPAKAQATCRAISGCGRT